MNIKIKDYKFFDNLYNSCFLKIEVGSSMYGLKNKNSDTDLLCIYNTSENELNSVFKSHHQIQYKKNIIDYLFVNIHKFIENCISGDSPINFEVINSDKLKNSELKFLYDNRKFFYTYKILKSYNGLAKRDIKNINKYAKTEYDKNKKVSHIYRSLKTIEKILLNNEIQLTEEEIKIIKNNIFKFDKENRKYFLEYLNSENIILREKINNLLDDEKIVKFMLPEYQKIIDNNIFNLLKNTKVKKADNFNLELFYDVNENWVSYD